MSIFRRKPATATKEEPSLLDIDDSIGPKDAPTATAKRSSFLGSWSRKAENQATTTGQLAAGSMQSKVTSSLSPKSISPRISTSSRTSVFERSVDSSLPQISSATTPQSHLGGQFVPRMVDPSHTQLVVDNQIPSVLDASVEAIVSNEDLQKVEVVTAQPCSTSESNPMPTLPNPWLEENLATAQISQVAGIGGAAKRLSFVSYADLLGVEQAEAEAASLHSHHSGSPRPLSPDTTSGATQSALSPLRPPSAPVDTLARRAKSVISLTTPSDLELTRTSMADTILQPSLNTESEINPWT